MAIKQITRFELPSNYADWLKVWEKLPFEFRTVGNWVTVGSNVHMRAMQAGNGNPNVVHIKYYNTVIAKFYSDDVIVICTGGYKTKRTKERLNTLVGSRAVIYQREYVWYIALRKDGAVDWDNPIRWDDDYFVIEPN